MTKQFTPENITSLPDNHIFVFGSNLAGSHGAGAAKVAVEHFGAKYGVGIGHVNQSYALPTKDFRKKYGAYDKRVLTIAEISSYVEDFRIYADCHPELTFWVTKIGCGLAGYSESDIAPLFANCISLDNVILPEEFYNIITNQNQ